MQAALNLVCAVPRFAQHKVDNRRNEQQKKHRLRDDVQDLAKETRFLLRGQFVSAKRDLQGFRLLASQAVDGKICHREHLLPNGQNCSMALQSVSFRGCTKKHIGGTTTVPQMCWNTYLLPPCGPAPRTPGYGGSSPAQIVLLIAHSLNGGNGLQCKEINGF